MIQLGQAGNPLDAQVYKPLQPFSLFPAHAETVRKSRTEFRPGCKRNYRGQRGVICLETGSSPLKAEATRVTC